MSQIFTAAPKVVNRGTRDLSKTLPLRQPRPIPIHLPLYYFFAQKGDLEKRIISASLADALYGEDTWNPRKDFYNVSTHFAKGTRSKQVFMGRRVVPDDIPDYANLCWSLEVVEADVQLYMRNIDGTFVRDNSGNKIPVSSGVTTTSGFKYRWLLTSLPTTGDPAQRVSAMFGKRETTQGTLIVGGANSTIYPIFDLMGGSLGSDANNTGARFWSPVSNVGVGVSKNIVQKIKCYPYAYSVLRRSTTSSSVSVKASIYNDQSTTFVLKPKATDPDYDTDLYANDVLVPNYRSKDDPIVEDVFPDIGAIHVYQDNIDTLLTMFTTAEMGAAGATTWYTLGLFTTNDAAVQGTAAWHDWLETDTVEQAKYLFNIFGGHTTANITYAAVVMDETVDTTIEKIRPSSTTATWLRNGGDGTMTWAKFQEAVKLEIQKYGDVNSNVIDPARNPENCFWDVGYSSDVKEEFVNFLAVRKSIIVGAATYVFGNAPLTLSQEQSQATSLMNTYNAYPDSEFYGTPCSRVTTFGFSGRVTGSNWKELVPANYDVMMWTCDHLGASNGVPNTVTRPMGSGYPGSAVTTMYDLSGTDIPTNIQERLWSINCNYPLPYDESTYYWPALQTIYPDDTSVMNSFRLSLCLAYAANQQYALQREMSGTESLTQGEYKEQSDAKLNARLTGVNKIYRMYSDTQFTTQDTQRGFSVTNTVKVGANNQITVMTANIDVYRNSDLPVTK